MRVNFKIFGKCSWRHAWMELIRRCPGCGNVNYASREVCNTRKCQMPRPSDDINGLSIGARPAEYDQPPGTQPSLHGAASGWTCQDCGNLNYGFRETCNTRKC